MQELKAHSRSKSPVKKIPKAMKRTAAALRHKAFSLGLPLGHRRFAEESPAQGTEMGRQIAIVLYVVAMAAVIVGVDLVFFRNRFWERLIVNSGIVLGFAAFYLRFLRRP